MAGLTKVKGSGLATGAATDSLVGIDDNATSTKVTLADSELTVGTGLVHVDGSASSNVASVALTRTDASWRMANETVWRLYGNTGDTTSPATVRLSVDTSGNVTVPTGNLVIGTSGKGIDFSAVGNEPGMTSEVLDAYEEGTWTAALSVESGTAPTYTLTTATYTKVGRSVTAYANFTITAAGSGLLRMTYPFTPSFVRNNYGTCTIKDSGSVWRGLMVKGYNTSYVFFQKEGVADPTYYFNASLLGDRLSVTIHYDV